MVQASGDQPLVYQWRLNGVPIDTSSNSSASTATLTIPEVRPEDTGQYDCVVVGLCGSVTSRAALLTICVPDFNCDGIVDFFDYDSFVIAYETGDPSADSNGDGFLDFFDYDEFVRTFEEGC